VERKNDYEISTLICHAWTFARQRFFIVLNGFGLGRNHCHLAQQDGAEITEGPGYG